jgi:oligoendopeptidase F
MLVKFAVIPKRRQGAWPHDRMTPEEPPLMTKVVRLPKRNQVKPENTWDLSSLYASDADWERDFQKLDGLIAGYAKFQGKLSESAKTLAACLKFDSDFDRLADRVGNYAFLKTTEDQADSRYQELTGRFQSLSTRASQAASFIRPEILAIPESRMQAMLEEKPLKHYRLVLERMLRYRPHTLSDREEKLLAMQGQMAQAAGKAFRQLVDADLKFGFVRNERSEVVELSQATFMQLLQSPRRNVRRTAFHQFYQQFVGHENTLAATLAGSIHKDIYYAKARNYPCALESSLFDDNVPLEVYDNLIGSVRKHLPSVHKYYEVRRRKMKLRDIHMYDTYVPILSELKVKRSWEKAVDVIVEALQPLGSEYVSTLEQGLRGRWCDRYPNVGKQSGAFSSGTYDGDPYILMNYKPEVLDDTFTLAHEAGHSMHSWYSKNHQSYEYYSYVIFVAEVASTFNEQLLAHHLLGQAKTAEERAYLLNHEIDAIRGTIIRQTMFAEFEKQTHALAEAGEALTVAAFKKIYRELLNAYFGPEFDIDDELELECFRIPHFYRAFYVYKYATGLSAAIALSQRVLNGGQKELNDYLSFLKGGCSKWPLDLLRDAGVDMRRPEPVDTALSHFDKLVDELDTLL